MNIRKWLHDKLEWHDGGRVQGFDGASFYGRCSMCGKRVLQDSQGNWFVARTQDDPELDARIAALAGEEKVGYPSNAACTRHLGEPWPCPKCAALAGEEK